MTKIGEETDKQMKTLFDIRHQFLNEHHERYCTFTKLLIILSVSFITLLVTARIDSVNGFSMFLKASLVFQLVSLCFGLIVQHQIMTGPLRDLNQVEQLQAQALENEDDTPMEIRRTPSLKERVSYKLQVVFFILSFVLISIHFMLI